MSKKDTLQEYRRKRDFERTVEPAGGREKAAVSQIFVIQEHHATRLHYDFRLEVGGVLKSWAVPRGLPTRTNEKRLAVETEDHPYEYANFEGNIPEGLYGAGEVIIWDKGTFHNLKTDVTMAESLQDGRATFWLNGKRAKGVFALVRTKMGDNKDKNWLLIKLDNKKLTGDLFNVPRNVSLLKDNPGKKASRQHEADDKSALPEIEQEVRKAPQPEWINPMLAVLTADRFSNEDWIFERKFDGERCLAFRKGNTVRLVSRNRKVINSSYPELVKAISKIGQKDFIFDGEIVAFDGPQTSFAKLQNRMNVQHPADKLIESVPVYYYIFDLLYFNGRDLMGAPLSYRKNTLRDNFDFDHPLRYTEHVKTRGKQYYQEACQRGWEGVIAKKIDSPYLQTRSDLWLKFKCVNEQEFVIGGWTDPAGSRVGLGAILIGYYKGDDLIYAGKVGTGFDRLMLLTLEKKLSALERTESPFSDKNIHVKGAHWARPELVAQIGFTEWTADGKLRHPRFEGLRRDKAPREILRERPGS